MSPTPTPCDVSIPRALRSSVLPFSCAYAPGITRLIIITTAVNADNNRFILQFLSFFHYKKRPEENFFGAYFYISCSMTAE